MSVGATCQEHGATASDIFHIWKSLSICAFYEDAIYGKRCYSVVYSTTQSEEDIPKLWEAPPQPVDKTCHGPTTMYRMTTTSLTFAYPHRCAHECNRGACSENDIASAVSRLKQTHLHCAVSLPTGRSVNSSFSTSHNKGTLEDLEGVDGHPAALPRQVPRGWRWTSPVHDCIYFDNFLKSTLYSYTNI